MDITEDRLRGLEKLVNAATPGPWTAPLTGNGETAMVVGLDGEAIRPIVAGDSSTADAHFIAAAREAVPALIAEVRRMWVEHAADTNKHIARLDATADECRQLQHEVSAAQLALDLPSDAPRDAIARKVAEVVKERDQIKYSLSSSRLASDILEEKLADALRDLHETRTSLHDAECRLKVHRDCQPLHEAEKDYLRGEFDRLIQHIERLEGARPGSPTYAANQALIKQEEDAGAVEAGLKILLEAEREAHKRTKANLFDAESYAAAMREALRDIDAHLPCETRCENGGKDVSSKCHECGNEKHSWCAGCIARSALTNDAGCSLLARLAAAERVLVATRAYAKAVGWLDLSYGPAEPLTQKLYLALKDAEPKRVKS